MLVLLERPKINDLCLIRRVKWSPNGNHIAAILFKRISGEPISTVLLWNLAGSADPEVLGEFPGRILSISFAGAGRFLAAGIDAETVRVWDLGNGNTTFDFPEKYDRKTRRQGNTEFHFPSFAKVAGNGGNQLFAYCIDHWCSVEPQTSSVRKNQAYDERRSNVESCAITADGSKLVLAEKSVYTSGENRNILKRFTINNGEFASETVLYEGNASCERVFVSKCGTRYGFANDSNLEIGSLDSVGTDRTALHGHESFVYAATFGPDNDTVITGGQDGTTRVWNLSQGVETAKYDWEIGRVTALDLSPDGGVVAAGGDGEHALVIWDLD